MNELLNENLSVSVEAKGAELTSIKSLLDQTEYLWQADPVYWKRHAPVLFPIVGSLENNLYIAENKEYSMGQHGLARDCDFVIAESTANSLTYSLDSNSDTLKKYPYKFNLCIEYKLEVSEITVGYLVKNTDTKPIWFSIGAHPGFNWPLVDGEKKEDYSLIFEKKETKDIRLLEKGLLTGKLRPYLHNQDTVEAVSEKHFTDDALIFQNLESSFVSYKNVKTGKGIKVTCAGFPYFGIWSPPSGAPFICLEPWFGIASLKGGSPELRLKEGILTLSPGQIFQCGFGIEVLG